MSTPHSDNNTTAAHIQGAWGIVAAVVASLVTGGLGIYAGSSWKEHMAEKVYNDNSILQEKILALTQEKEEFRNKFNNTYKELNNKKNAYDNLKKEYETAIYNYHELQKKYDSPADKFTPQEVVIAPSTPDSPILQQGGKQFSLMQVAAPYDFHAGEAYTNGKNFIMSGTKYTDGFVLKGSIADGYALINLGHKYSEISFHTGHIDKTTKHRDAILYIIADGNILREEKISNDLPPQKIEVPLNYAGGLKIQIDKGSGSYGFANIILKD